MKRAEMSNARNAEGHFTCIGKWILALADSGAFDALAGAVP
jgi:hypothetical protein